MKILVNGREMNLDDGRSLSDLLTELNVPPRYVAVEYNGDLYEGDRDACLLREGDRLEIVRFVGGG